MKTQKELLAENIELRSKLALAEKWMRREVASSIKKVREDKLKKDQRKYFENAFESESLDIFTRDIISLFGESLDRAPKYTLERLIDAEIYWFTLQKYPQMDALPVVLAYQKILDAWIEESLIMPWRESEKWKMKNEKYDDYSDNLLEKDLGNILSKKYTLSIGRFYQIIEMVREKKVFFSWVSSLVSFWKKEYPELLAMFISDRFFLPFSELMQREIFSKKRHEKKVSYTDAKRVREILVRKDGLLLSILL